MELWNLFPNLFENEMSRSSKNVNCQLTNSDKALRRERKGAGRKLSRSRIPEIVREKLGETIGKEDKNAKR